MIPSTSNNIKIPALPHQRVLLRVLVIARNLSVKRKRIKVVSSFSQFLRKPRMSLEAVTSQLSSLSISVEKKSHSAVDSLKAWVEAVKSIDASCAPCKTLVLKPSKGPNSNLILVISQDSTALSVGALAKSLGYKDARMAQDDLVTSAFGIDKMNCKSWCPCVLSRSNAGCILVCRCCSRI